MCKGVWRKERSRLMGRTIVVRIFASVRECMCVCCVCVCVYVCVCVCMCTEKYVRTSFHCASRIQNRYDIKIEIFWARERESVCVCVCEWGDEMMDILIPFRMELHARALPLSTSLSLYHSLPTCTPTRKRHHLSNTCNSRFHHAILLVWLFISLSFSLSLSLSLYTHTSTQRINMRNIHTPTNINISFIRKFQWLHRRMFVTHRERAEATCEWSCVYVWCAWLEDDACRSQKFGPLSFDPSNEISLSFIHPYTYTHAFHIHIHTHIHTYTHTHTHNTTTLKRHNFNSL